MMIRRSSKRYQAVFDGLHDPLLLVDTDGQIHRANAAAVRTLDMGDPPRLQHTVSLEPAFKFDGEQVLSLVRQGAPLYGRRLEDESGNASDAVLDIVAVDDKDSRFKLVHVKDFSTLTRYERWKDELISMVAHEIKNPLSAVRNTMDILISQVTKGEDTGGQKKLLTTSIRGIDRLTRLLDGFLEVSRVGAGKHALDVQPVDLREFVPDVIDSFQTLFNVQRQSLVCKIADEIGVVRADAPKLEQVMINLLSNAVKFTPPGGSIRVSVRPASLEALGEDWRILPWRDICDMRFFRIAIADTGIGMNAETLAHLFTRYHRGTVDDAPAGALPAPPDGSHLGLNISKVLTEVQHGRLEVESEPGVGTEVSVYLPEDVQTMQAVRHLKSIDRCLRAARDACQPVEFYAFRKYEAVSWPEIARSWRGGTRIDPERGEERGSAQVLWTFGGDVAFMIAVGAAGSPAIDALGGERGGKDWGTSRGGYMVGRCRAPEDATRLLPLVRAALERMKQASPVLSTDVESHLQEENRNG